MTRSTPSGSAPRLPAARDTSTILCGREKIDLHLVPTSALLERLRKELAVPPEPRGRPGRTAARPPLWQQKAVPSAGRCPPFSCCGPSPGSTHPVGEPRLQSGGAKGAHGPAGELPERNFLMVRAVPAVHVRSARDLAAAVDEAARGIRRHHSGQHPVPVEVVCTVPLVPPRGVLGALCGTIHDAEC